MVGWLILPPFWSCRKFYTGIHDAWIVIFLNAVISKKLTFGVIIDNIILTCHVDFIVHRTGGVLAGLPGLRPRRFFLSIPNEPNLST